MIGSISTPTMSMSTTSIAKVAAFATLATILAMMAFVTIPGAEGSTAQKVLKVKILNNIANVKDFKIIVKDIANNNKIVYVKNVKILSGNSLVVNAPITISGNTVNLCVQALNVQVGLVNVVAQKCKTVSFSDTDVRFVTFSFGS
jgi:hypothetical protein